MAKVPLICYQSGINVAPNSTVYSQVATSRLNPDATETNRVILYRSAGTFSKLFVRITSNGVTADSTVTLRKNTTTDTSITLTIGNSASGTFEDSTHTESSAAGDKWTYKIVTGATGTSLSVSMICICFAATTNTISKYCVLGGSITATTTTYFALASGPAATGDTTETNIKARIRQTGTFKNMYVRVATNSKAGDTPVRFRKNGADSGPAVTIGSNATGDFEDTSNTSSVAAGDDANTALMPSVAGTLALNVITLELETTDSKGWLYGNRMGTTTQGEPLTRFFPLGGMLEVVTTESTTQMKTMEAFTFSELTFHISANSIGASTYKFRKNTADGSQSGTIGASATGYFSATGSDTCDADDLVCATIVTPATSGTQTMTIRAVGITTELAAAGNAVERSLAAETITIGGGTIARLAAKTRTRADTIVISETRTRLAAKNRAPAAQTVSVTEASLVRIKGKVRTLATETVMIAGGTLSRLAAKIRTRSETVIISDARARVKGTIRALATQTVALSDSVARQVSEGAQQIERALSTETVAISESLFRLKAANRPLAVQTVTVTGGTIARLKASFRTIGQTVPTSENVARLSTKLRSLATQTVTVGGGTLARIKGANRSLATQTVTVSAGTLARIKGMLRTIPQTITIGGGTLTRIRGIARVVIQTTIITENLAKRMTKMRALATQTIILSEELNRVVAGANDVVKTITQTVIVSDNIVRLTAKLRTISETTTISAPLTRIKSSNRILSDTKTIGGGTAVRIKGAVKTLNQTIMLADNVTKRLAQIRTISQTINITAPVTRVKSANRLLSDSKSISDSLLKVKGSIKSITQTTIISETLNRLLSQTRIIAQNISISGNVTGLVNILQQNIIRTAADTVGILETLQIYVVRASERFRRIRDPSVWKLKSNHPAWLLGSRGEHDHYEEFSP